MFPTVTEIYVSCLTHYWLDKDIARKWCFFSFHI